MDPSEGALHAWREHLQGKLDAHQCEQWITQHPSIANDTDKGGWTALHFAVYFVQPIAVKVIVKLFPAMVSSLPHPYMPPSADSATSRTISARSFCHTLPVISSVSVCEKN